MRNVISKLLAVFETPQSMAWSLDFAKVVKVAVAPQVGFMRLVHGIDTVVQPDVIGMIVWKWPPSPSRSPP